MVITCTHYWEIDSKDIGTCRYCGILRDFRALQNEKRKSSPHSAKTIAGGKKNKGKKRGG